MLRITRNELMRVWMDHYRSMETSMALLAIDKNRGRLRERMRATAKQSVDNDTRALQGMAYGVHGYCRSLLTHRGAVVSPLTGGYNERVGGGLSEAESR